jgi:hypothetical protein
LKHQIRLNKGEIVVIKYGCGWDKVASGWYLITAISPLFSLIPPAAIFNHHQIRLNKGEIRVKLWSPLFNLIPPAVIFNHHNFTLIQPYPTCSHI